MRTTLLEQMKSEIENNLRQFLREEGIELYVAANDNRSHDREPQVVLESLDDRPLEDSRLLSEIRVILGVLCKPWKSEALINGIYEALHPHHVTHRELTVLLMSLHVETVHCVRPRCIRKRTVMRYIVEETEPVPANENHGVFFAGAIDSECC